MSKSILLSGGIDSISLAYWLKPEIAFTIDYGQLPAMAEIKAARQVSEILGIQHEVITVDCGSLGSGDLSGKKALSIAPSSEWWPYRNQLLVTLASMRAVSLGVSEIITGTVKSDGFHKDGTIGFFERINNLMKFQEGEMLVSSPAITLTSIELIRASEVPYEILLWAHSCHRTNIPCGACPGCLKHLAIRQSLDLEMN